MRFHDDVASGRARICTRQLSLDLGEVDLPATLTLPACASGIVLLTESGVGRNVDAYRRHVVHALGSAGLGTLLFDLLTAEEDADAQADLRFEVVLLARRLLSVARWAAREAGAGPLPLGFFGAGTGGAAALIAAAEEPALVSAVASRAGHPELAGRWLPRVAAPTLLIVGETDREARALNQDALVRLGGLPRLSIVPGGRRFFDEAGALAQVARLASGWFVEHLSAGSVRACSPAAALSLGRQDA